MSNHTNAQNESVTITFPVERWEELTNAVDDYAQETARVEGYGLLRYGWARAQEVLRAGTEVDVDGHACVRVTAPREVWDALQDVTDTFESPWEWEY